MAGDTRPILNSVTPATLHPFNPVIMVHGFTSGAPLQQRFSHSSRMPCKTLTFTYLAVSV